MKKLFTETDLINFISSKLKDTDFRVKKGIGDDAAVIDLQRNKSLHLFTCDSLVSGIHFKEEYMSMKQIGMKSAAVNISDIAAMGGVPRYMLVSLFLPQNFDRLYVGEIYKGINDECKKFDISVVGGNISRSNTLILDIFLIGYIESGKPVYRSGAKPGDAVIVTGTLGDSAIGLQLLLHTHDNDRDTKYLIDRHILPVPRVAEGQFVARDPGVHSMIDLSDGLSTDINHLCVESNVGVKLFSQKLPMSKSLTNVAKKLNMNTTNLVMNGGEDYELCFTLARNRVPSFLRAFKKCFKTNITVIGEILDDQSKRIVVSENQESMEFESCGWDHCKS